LHGGLPPPTRIPRPRLNRCRRPRRRPGSCRPSLQGVREGREGRGREGEGEERERERRGEERERERRGEGEGEEGRGRGERGEVESGEWRGEWGVRMVHVIRIYSSLQ